MPFSFWLPYYLWWGNIQSFQTNSMIWIHWDFLMVQVLNSKWYINFEFACLKVYESK